MRSEDRALAAREPGLPGLALLLDDDAFAAALGDRLPEAGIVAARGTYVRHKPGTNCLVAYELETRAGTQLAYARAERLDEQSKLAKAEVKATAASALGAGGVTLEHWGVAVLGFPNDRALPGLPRLDRGRRPITVLAYKPERRLVARRGRRVVKVYADDRFAAARAAAAALPVDAGFQLQRCIGANDRRRSLEFAWIDGAPLDGMLTPALAGEAGRLLRALHRAAPAVALRVRTEHEQASSLLAAASATGIAGQGVERAARALARRLARLLVSAGATPRLLHGDFSADQVLVGPGGMALADLDEMVIGDPAEDLGSALADLELRVLEGRLDADDAGAAGEALVAAHGCGAERLAALTAAGLLRRSAEPFRRRRPGWDALVEAAVERAAALVRRPRSRPPGTTGVLAALTTLDADGDGDAVLRRAWPRPGARLLLEYRTPGGGVVGAQWSRDPERLEAELRGAVPAPVRAEAAPGVDVVVHRHGADWRLPGLPVVLAAPGARLLAHRPSRRAAVRLAGGEAFVKVVRPDRAQAVASAMRQARRLAGGAFAVPAVEAVDAALGTVTCTALRGSALTGLLAAPEAEEAVKTLGEALCTLHSRTPPTGLPAHDAASEGRLLRRFAAALAPYAPSLAGPAEAAARAAGDRLAGLDAGRLVPLHRDLHDKQVLVDPHGGIGLIDFDTLALGDPALDLGNLVAHFELRALQGLCTPAGAERLSTALLAGYGAGTALRRRVRAYAAATRVRLACVYALRPLRPWLAEALLWPERHDHGTTRRVEAGTRRL